MPPGRARILETERLLLVVALYRRRDEAVDGWSWSAHICSNTVRYHGCIVVSHYNRMVVYNESR